MELKLRYKAEFEKDGNLGSFADLSETTTKNRTELIKEANGYLLFDYLFYISKDLLSLLTDINKNRGKISLFIDEIKKIRGDKNISDKDEEDSKELQWLLENPEKTKMIMKIKLTREQLEEETKWFYEGFFEKTDAESKKIRESSDLEECERELEKAKEILTAYANQHLTEFAGLDDELAIEINSLKDIPEGGLENYLASLPLSFSPKETNSLGAIVKLKAWEISEKKKRVND